MRQRRGVFADTRRDTERSVRATRVRKDGRQSRRIRPSVDTLPSVVASVTQAENRRKIHVCQPAVANSVRNLRRRSNGLHEASGDEGRFLRDWPELFVLRLSRAASFRSEFSAFGGRNHGGSLTVQRKPFYIPRHKLTQFSNIQV